MKAYLDQDWDYFKEADRLTPKGDLGIPRIAEIVNYHFYHNGEHKFVIDEETALSILEKIGFVDATISEYMEGMDPPEQHRREYSFYIDAQK